MQVRDVPFGEFFIIPQMHISRSKALICFRWRSWIYYINSEKAVIPIVPVQFEQELDMDAEVIILDISPEILPFQMQPQPRLNGLDE